MNSLQTVLAALFLTGAATQGALYTSDAFGTATPAANPAGISSTLKIMGAGIVPGDVSDRINVSGGSVTGLDARDIQMNDAGTANFHERSGSSLIIGDCQRDSVEPPLGSFNDSKANGGGAILFASKFRSGETGTSSLVSFGLQVTPVPEPANVALGIFGGVFLAAAVAKSRRARVLVRRWRAGSMRPVNAV